MKKSNIATLLVFLLLIPATLFLGTKLPGRSYYITGTLIIIELMIPFFMAFEGRRPQARELVLIAVMCALAIAGRVAIPIQSLCLQVLPLGRKQALWWVPSPPLAAIFFTVRVPTHLGRCSATAQAECLLALPSLRDGCPERFGRWQCLALQPLC